MREFKLGIVVTGDGKGGVSAIRATNAELKALQQQATRTSAATKSIGDDLKRLASGQNALASASRAVSGLLASVGAGVSFGAFISNAIEAERSVTKINAVLKATQGVSGQTSASLQAMASELQNVTEYSDDAVMAAQATLLTFDKIGGSVFPRTIRAAADLAAVMGTDLTSATFTLGKALQDPAEGLGVLTKQGIRFDESAKLNIESLVEMGRASEAQAMILAELESRVGGTAAAMRDDLGGAVSGVKNAFSDLLEGDGSTEELKSSLNGLTETLKDPDIKEGFNNIASGIAGVTGFLATGVGFLQAYYSGMGRFFAEMALNADGMSGDIRQSLAKATTHVESYKKALQEGFATDADTTHLQAGLKAAEDRVRSLTAAVRELNLSDIADAVSGPLIDLQNLAAGNGGIPLVLKSAADGFIPLRDGAIAAAKGTKQLTKEQIDASKAIKTATDSALAQARVTTRTVQLIRQGVSADVAAKQAKLELDNVASANIQTILAADKALQDLNDETDARVRALNLLIKVEDDQREAAKKNAEAYKDSQREIAEIQAEAGQRLEDFLNADSFASAAADMRTALGTVGEPLVGLVDGFDELGKIAEQSGQAISDAHLKAQGDTEKLNDLLADIGQKTLIANVGAFGKLADAASGFFEESSSGYQLLQNVSKAFHAAELALTVQELVPKAISAVLGQGSGDPYTAFARMAAMATFVAGLGVSIGGGGSGSSTPEPTSVGIGTGKGTVLGDSDAYSESMSNSLDALEELQQSGLRIEEAQLQSLRSIEAALAGVGNLLYRQNATTGGPTPFNIATTEGNSSATDSVMKINGVLRSLDPVDGMLTKMNDLMGGVFDKISGGLFSGITQLGGDILGSVVGGLFGKVTKKQIDEGLLIDASQTLGDVLADGLDIIYYATIEKTKKSWFKKKKSQSDITGDLDDGLENQFEQLIIGIGDSAIKAAEMLGMKQEEAAAILSEIELNIGKISFDDLKPEEVQERLNAVFSSLGDTFAAALIPELLDFQRVGEGLYETLMRVASETAAVIDVMGSLGNAFGDATGSLQTAEIAQELISLAGGIDQFAENVTGFIDTFTTEGEKFERLQADLASALSNVGLTIPRTENELRDLVRGLDVTTDSGQRAFTMLTSLNEGLDAYYSRLRAQADFLADIQTQITSAGLSGQDLDLFNLDREFDKMRAEATELGVDLATIEQLYGIRRTAIVEQYAQEAADAAMQAAQRAAADREREQAEAVRAAQDAADERARIQREAAEEAARAAEEAIQAARRRADFNADLSNRVRAAGLNGKDLDLFNLQVEFDQLRDQAREVGGDLSKIEKLYGLERAAILKRYADEAIEAQQAAAEEAANALREAYQRTSSELQATIDKFGGFADSLSAFRDELNGGELALLSPLEEYERLKAQFNDLSALAATGDEDALSKIEGVARDLLDASKGVNASSSAYFSDLDAVKAAIDLAKVGAEIEVDVAQQQLDAIKDQVSKLIELNESVLSIPEAISTLLAARAAAGITAPTATASSQTVPTFAGETVTVPTGSVTGATPGPTSSAATASSNANVVAAIKELTAQVKTGGSGAKNVTLKMSIDERALVDKLLQLLRDKSYHGETVVFDKGIAKA